MQKILSFNIALFLFFLAPLSIGKELNKQQAIDMMVALDKQKIEIAIEDAVHSSTGDMHRALQEAVSLIDRESLHEILVKKYTERFTTEELNYYIKYIKGDIDEITFQESKLGESILKKENTIVSEEQEAMLKIFNVFAPNYVKE